MSSSGKTYDPERGFAFVKKKRDFQKVQSVLKSTLKTFGLQDQFLKHQFVLHWPEIVGNELARHTRPECIKNGALVVRVHNSIWAQELSFHKQVILKRLSKFLRDDQLVDDVRFYTGDLQS